MTSEYLALTLFREEVDTRSAGTFFLVSALLFAASAALTVIWGASMSAMGEMAMPGGWTMSMVWMRMPGQTWPGAAASFLGMWDAMMLAMMLPSLVPMLWRFRQALGMTGTRHPGGLAALVGITYFVVWTVLGVLAFASGIPLTTLEMHEPALARAVPIAASAFVVLAGVFQFTAWKSRHLGCWRAAPEPALPVNALGACREGGRLGLECGRCCANLIVVLLVVGVMDVRAMAVIAASITAERLAPAGERVARAIGAVAIGAGLFLVAAAIV